MKGFALVSKKMHLGGYFVLRHTRFMISLIMLQLTVGIGDKLFARTREETGTDLCATDEPSLVFDPQLTDVQLMGTTCVPLGTYCAWKCSLEPNCTNFNYREDVGKCELFFYTPNNCTSIQFCTHSEVKGLGSCLTQASNDSTRCSFPFTYNGQLYYHCTQNTTNTAEVGCFAENRTWITCPVSQLGYIAQNVTINITIPAINASTQVISVDNWIVIQQRIDNSTYFGQNWDEYRSGFGVYNFNYWMGLERIHQLIKPSQYRLRIEVYFPSLIQWRSVEYSSVFISSERGNYTLQVSGFSGDVDDDLQLSTPPGKWLNGMQFSTPDRDHDKDTTRHCAQNFSSGWWFNGCSYINLNGLINEQNPTSHYFEYYINLTKTIVRMSRMMVRKV